MHHQRTKTPKSKLSGLTPPRRLPFGPEFTAAGRLSSLLLALGCFPLTASADEGGWEYQPYRIHALLAIEAPGGMAERLAEELPLYLTRRVEAAIMPYWSFDVALAAGTDRNRVFADIGAGPGAPPAELPADKDKLLLLAVRWHPEGWELSAREFDRYVQRWGMPIRRECRQDSALPEQLFALAWQIVAPLAQLEVDEKDASRILLTPRGASLPRGAGAAPWANKGDLYLPILRRTSRGGQLVEKNGIQPVPWTYIEAAEVKDNKIVCSAQSASRRPFGTRKQGRTEQLAIALRADPDATTLHLQSRKSAGKPLVGYEVFRQNAGELAPTRMGASDNAGDLSIPPGTTRVEMLLIKHGGQLLARLPVVPGAERQVNVPLPDDDARLAAEARLAALREDLVDVVARRNILMARARQKIEKKDLAAAEELLRSLDELPGRAQFNLTLSTAARLLRSDDPQIQRRIDQLFSATQTLLTQYLELRPISKLHDELREAQRKGSQKGDTAKPEPPAKG